MPRIHLNSQRRRVPASKSTQRMTTRTLAEVQGRVPRFFAQNTTRILPPRGVVASVPATSMSALSAFSPSLEGGAGVGVSTGSGVAIGVGIGAAPGAVSGATSGGDTSQRRSGFERAKQPDGGRLEFQRSRANPTRRGPARTKKFEVRQPRKSNPHPLEEARLHHFHEAANARFWVRTD